MDMICMDSRGCGTTAEGLPKSGLLRVSRRDSITRADSVDPFDDMSAQQGYLLHQQSVARSPTAIPGLRDSTSVEAPHIISSFRYIKSSLQQ